VAALCFYLRHHNKKKKRKGSSHEQSIGRREQNEYYAQKQETLAKELSDAGSRMCKGFQEVSPQSLAR